MGNTDGECESENCSEEEEEDSKQCVKDVTEVTTGKNVVDNDISLSFEDVEKAVNEFGDMESCKPCSGRSKKLMTTDVADEGKVSN